MIIDTVMGPSWFQVLYYVGTFLRNLSILLWYTYMRLLYPITSKESRRNYALSTLKYDVADLKAFKARGGIYLHITICAGFHCCRRISAQNTSRFPSILYYYCCVRISNNLEWFCITFHSAAAQLMPVVFHAIDRLRSCFENRYAVTLHHHKRMHMCPNQQLRFRINTCPWRKSMSKALTECRPSGVGTGMGVFATCRILKDQTVWREELDVYENRCNFAGVWLNLMLCFTNYNACPSRYCWRYKFPLHTLHELKTGRAKFSSSEIAQLSPQARDRCVQVHIP